MIQDYTDSLIKAQLQFQVPLIIRIQCPRKLSNYHKKQRYNL